MKSVLLTLMVFVATLFYSCNSSDPVETPKKETTFNPEDVKNVIIANGKKWGQAMREKDTSIIKSIYDDSAHYLPDADIAIHGNKNITEYWKSSIGVINDLELTMESLEGTKELLYETGTGVSYIGGGTYRYKYVNVWKLQPNGEYKVVIDTYNDVKR